MHFIRPYWLSHGGEKKAGEVYSVHVSPDSERLATGGIDGTVRIWSTKAILTSTDPTMSSSKMPRQLCSLTHHTGAVHAVRFSGNNRYLASGSDDKIVLVYERDANATVRPAFGSGEGHTEVWRTHRRLSGHDHDVIDLGWSADSSILVSVGLDSKIVIWSGSSFERLKRIDVHQSHVKGITFDPANKYFATASDDRSVKVFRFVSPGSNATAHDQAGNFTLESTITAPFQESPLTTYFRRCSWSPDGSHIAAANAVNGPVSSVAILNRGSWDGDINLIGHEGPVEVCAFAPRMFSKEPIVPGVPPVNPVTVIACAGQDKALSIWNTSNPRPLVITQDIATKAISDLAWSPDGTTLFVSSLDGAIICMVFEEGDLGYVLGAEENDRILQKYGVGRKGATLPEGTDSIRLEELSKAGERRELEGRMGQLMMDGTNGVNGAPAPVPNGGQWQNQSAATTDQPPAPQEPEKEKPFKQKITITKDGKKRVAPLLVSTGGGHRSNLPPAHLLQAQQSSGGAPLDPKLTLEISKPYDGLPKGGMSALIIGNKRKQPEPDAEEATQPAKPGIPILSTPGPRAPIEPPEFIRPAVISASVTTSQVRLGVPKVRSIVQRVVDKSGAPSAAIPPVGGSSSTSATAATKPLPAPTDTVFEARNVPSPARISISRNGQVQWLDFLPRSVLLATGNHNFWAAATEDGVIHLWTPVGRRFMNPLILEAQPCILKSHGWHLMAITAVGTAHIWNLRDPPSALHPPVSIAPILDAANILDKDRHTQSEAVIDADINASGCMLISLSNGDGFTYNANMCIWQRLSEGWWPAGSSYWDTTPNRAGMVAHLERRTTNESLLHGRGRAFGRMFKQALNREGFEGIEASISIAHLENRMAAAMVLGSGEEFKSALMTYMKRCAAEGLVGKVEEGLRELMGGIDEDEESEDESESEAEEAEEGEETERRIKTGRRYICGLEKKELLKNVLMAIGKYRDLQRVTLPYARILGIIDSDMYKAADEEQLRQEAQGRRTGAATGAGEKRKDRDGDENMD